MELELASGTCRVDVLMQTTKTNLPLLQLLNLGKKILKRSPQPVKAPHNKCVTCSHISQSLVETWPVTLGAAHLISEDFFTAGLLQRIGLQVETLVFS